MRIPREIQHFMDKISQLGYDIYIVGGYVRDRLLHFEPSDIDLATNAPEEAVLSVLSKHQTARTVGKAFPATLLCLGEHTVELARFRKRTGNGIELDGDILTDLSCRDFTINSIAMRVDGKILDPIGGGDDLDRGILRSLDPRRVIAEDPVRILRAIYFSAKYDLKMDGELENTIAELGSRLEAVSEERLRDILIRMLMLDKPSSALRKMIGLGLARHLPGGEWLERMTGFDQETPFHDRDLLEHTLAAVDQTPKAIEVRLAALLHDIGKPDVKTHSGEVAHYYGHEKKSAEMSREILKEFRCSGELVGQVSTLIECHMFNPFDIGEAGIKRLVRKTGGFEAMRALLALMRADLLATAYPERAVCINDLQGLVDRLETSDSAFKRGDLNIGGADLIALGMTQGRQIGRLLNEILELVMDNMLPNEKQALIEYAQTHLRRKV